MYGKFLKGSIFYLCMLLPFFTCECNNIKLNDKENIIFESYFNKKTNEENVLNKKVGKEMDDRFVAHKSMELNINHHNINNDKDLKNNEHHDYYHNWKDRKFSDSLKRHMDDLKILNNDLKEHINKKERNERYDNNDLHKYIIKEIQNNRYLNKEKKSSEDIQILEEHSKKLQREIHEWLESVNNIEEKSNILKNIKSQLLNNIASLNHTLSEEIKNINDIKELQKQQNDIFSENLLYFLPSSSDYVLNENKNNIHDNKDNNIKDNINNNHKYNIFNYLQNIQDKDNNNDNYNNNNNYYHNNIHSGHSTHNHILLTFIIFLLILLIL
ncbi:apical merozoite protein [Plasmodium gaboni]|uniref:Apical merozoite protein n=1 Tax=Plasmodium gaboni TaxID=647221 RepID=A0ABY1UIW1_9APIC|nr:apical merozoite protein [Plasmodium gaboni]